MILEQFAQLASPATQAWVVEKQTMDYMLIWAKWEKTKLHHCLWDEHCSLFAAERISKIHSFVDFQDPSEEKQPV